MDPLLKYVQYIPYLGAGLLWGLVVTPLAAAIAKRFGFVDLPPAMRDKKDDTKSRRIHTSPMPRLGGVVVTLPIMIMPLILPASPWLLGLAFCVGVMNIMAILDDKYEVSAKIQLPVLGTVAAIAALSGITILRASTLFDGTLNFSRGAVDATLLGENFRWYVLAVAVTVLWICVVANAINWTDLIGGIASAISGLAIMVVMLVAIRDANHEVAVISAVVLGAILGFLPFNVVPEKIFLGGGSMSLGFTVAALSVLAQTKFSTWIIVLGLPVIDFVLVIIGRAVKAKPKSFKAFLTAIATSDKTHLPFRLKEAGLERYQVFWVMSGITFLFAILALIVSGLFLTVMVIAVCVIIIMGYLVIDGLVRRHRQKTAEPTGATPEQKYSY